MHISLSTVAFKTPSHGPAATGFWTTNVFDTILHLREARANVTNAIDLKSELLNRRLGVGNALERDELPSVSRFHCTAFQ